MARCCRRSACRPGRGRLRGTARRPHRGVTKAALMDRAWPGTIVEEGKLAVQIATLRKALGTTADGRERVATVARLGYRLVRKNGHRDATGRASIAVLPFVDLSSNPEEAFV
ncbi:MAG: hypothetical protein EON59_07400 [Alphaproteobacteria bacterium]|nr:MAG: hypothetical protein EON59_07400 [Alphaproteobacteria bacterium]